MDEVQLPYFSRFIDKATLLAKARGEETASFTDIWRALADLHVTVDVLKQRGIEPYRLESELRYLTIFEPRHVVHAKNLLDDMKADQADMVDKFFEDFLDYVDHLEVENKEGYKAVAQDLSQFLGNYLTSWERPGSPFSAEGYIPMMLIQSMLERFMEQESVNEELDPATVQHMGQFMMSQYMNVLDAPLMKLTLMLQQSEEAGVIVSPQKLVEMVEKISPPAIQEMLYRAGAAAPRNHVPQFDLPEREIVDLALSAHSLAESQRQSTVDPGHLLLASLRGLHGQSYLKKLGVQDQTKFRNALSKKLWPNLGEQRYRTDVQIPKTTSKLLGELVQVSDDADSAGEAQLRIFDRLLAQPKLRAALKSAGLTDEKLDSWEGVRDALVQQEAEQEKAKTSVEGFQISDRALDDSIERYGRDLTKLASDGRLPKIAGREAELRAAQTALLQKEKGNAIFLGEAGVGKTAMFEGFAQQVVNGQVPDKLLGARVVELDLAAMNAGASYRGQFEERLLTVVKGVAERNASGRFPPVVLCIDELHAALQAGSASGTPDAGELLKPYLARGDVRVLSATTEAEFKKFISSNPALERRFDPIKIDPPKGAALETIVTTRGAALGSHHGVAVPQELLARTVQLADRFIHSRYQPARTVDVLDKACAHAVIAGSPVLTLAHVHGAVAEISKLPVEFVGQTDAGRILGLRTSLPGRVIGQETSTAVLAQTMITASADLQNPGKPLGSFLLVGPTGVGKTETGRALAELLFGSREALIKIDMNGFTEAHSVARLIGSPPGYVGFGQEGEFGAVRRQPYSVLMLDEIEKAHPDVLKLLLSVMEDGKLKDGSGYTIDFSNTLLLMSSNLGVEAAANVKPAIGFSDKTDMAARRTEVFEAAINGHFAPEFRNRLSGTLHYDYLEQQHIAQLVDIQLKAVAQRAQARWGVGIDATAELKAELAAKGFNRQFGARPLERAVRTQVADPLAVWLLEQQAAGTVLLPGSTLQLDKGGAAPTVLPPPAANTEAKPATPQRRARPRLG